MKHIYLSSIAMFCLQTIVFAQAETQNPNGASGLYWRVKGNAGTDTAQNFLGTTDANYLTFRTNNIRRMTIDTGGRVGIGTTQPNLSGMLEITNTINTNPGIIISNYGSPNELWFRRAQGTISAPAIVGTNGSLGRIDGRGYDGSTYLQATRIEMLVDSASASGLMTGRLAFLTAPAGSAPVERMRINRNGLVGINTTAPLTRLDINGDIALRQAALTLANGANHNVVINPHPSGYSYYRITGPTAAYSITGFTAAGATDGRVLIIQNATTQILTLTDQSTLSTTSNRIMTGGGTLIVGDSGTVTLIYSVGDNRWHVQSYANAVLSGGTFANAGWNTVGNAGLSNAVNFLGTTDNADVIIKRQNEEAFRAYPGGALVGVGNTSTGVVPVSGFGTRLMWAPAKNAFRAGNVNGVQWDDANVGIGSAAFGANNTASGNNTFAAGNGNTVSGQNSLVVGNNNTVTATHALVSGNGNNAAGNFSVVFNNTASSTAAATTSMAGGFQSQTQANLSIAIGWADTAKGVASVALGGFSNEARADYSFSTGNNNLSSGAQAATFGSGNTAGGSNSFATGNNNNVSGQNSLVMGNGNTVSATHALVSGNGNNAAGNFSVVLNNTNSSTASATTSISGGFQSQTQANLSFAIGYADTATAQGAVALGGFSNLASGSNSFSTGNNTTASGAQAAAFGDGNVVSGFNSLATGNSNTVSSTRSLVSGINNDVAGENNVVSGVQNQIVTPYGHSIVIGFQDTLSGSSSAVFGYLNKATAFTTFAMGDRNVVSGQTASAFGYQNVASGVNSFVTGQQDTTLGNLSSAFGTGNRAASFNEMAIGMYGTQYTATSTTAFNATDRIFNVGIGTAANARADAFTILKGGNVCVRGLATGGAFITAPSATTDKLVFADASGDLRAIANGSSGQVLTINGSGVPQWSTGSSNAWNLTGNAGTVDGTNFIGTIDSVPFNIRVNNQRAGKIDLIRHSVIFGHMAGNANTTAQLNVLVGDSAGFSMTTGFRNTLVGNRAGRSIVDGIQNTFVGNHAGVNTTGSNNTFVGSRAGFNTTTAGANTFMGESSGANNTTGSFNSFYGQASGANNTTGSSNTFIGRDAGAFTNTGLSNAFVGFEAGRNNTTGESNAFFGENAGRINTTGSYNTALGDSATVSAVNLTNATAVGAKAMAGNSNVLVLGSINGINNANASVKVGIGTTNPPTKLTIYDPDNVNVTLRVASVSTAYEPALELMRTGAGGEWKIRTNTTGQMAFSRSPDDFVTNVDYYEMTATSYRPAIDDNNSLGEAGARWATVFATNGTINTSDFRDKENVLPLHYGINEVMKLRPVTFNWKENPQWGKKIGFIAQDVQPILSEVVQVGNLKSKTPVLDDNGNPVPSSDKLGIYYSDIIPVTVKAIQEQQQMIEIVKKENADLKIQLEMLKQRMNQLEKK